MPITPPRFERVEALNFGDFSIYPDKTGRYSVHGSQLKDLIEARDTASSKLVEEWKARGERLAAELAEERTRSANGLKLIQEAQAGITALTEENKRLQIRLAEVDRQLAAAENAERDAIFATQAAMDERDAARNRIKVLEGSAEPFAWGFEHVDPNGRVIPYARTAKSNANAEAGILGGHEVFPLYRHPPKPAAETKHYPAWETSGGPNECPHGYAAGIPCQRCDVAKAKPAGEPVAWQANPQPGLIGAITPDKAIAERWASKGLVVRALYKAPPAAQAIGVTDERFIALGTNDSCVRALGIPNSARIVGTRAEVDAAIRASLGDSRWLRQTYEPVRVVPIGSPTVRLDLLHALIAKAEAGGFTIQPSSIRAAIGEKGG